MLSHYTLRSDRRIWQQSKCMPALRKSTHRKSHTPQINTPPPHIELHGDGVEVEVGARGSEPPAYEKFTPPYTGDQILPFTATNPHWQVCDGWMLLYK